MSTQMSMNMVKYMSAHTMHVPTHMFAQLSAAHMPAPMSVHMPAHMSAHTSAHMSAHMLTHVCTHVYTHACAHVCTRQQVDSHCKDMDMRHSGIGGIPAAIAELERSDDSCPGCVVLLFLCLFLACCWLDAPLSSGTRMSVCAFGVQVAVKASPS